ncbi:MAG: pentapeptide repeat-containing protein, partial [Acidobacteriota bacterium]
MKLLERLARWEGMVFGFLIGIAATVAASMAYNEVNGFLHVSHWRRSLHNGLVREIAILMEDELETAEAALQDGAPLDLSHYLAYEYMPRLYAHQMAYAMTLLRNEGVGAFNNLRATNPFLTLALTDQDLSHLDLSGADFSRADLRGAKFRGSTLTGATFFESTMAGAELAEAELGRALFDHTDLSSATLTAVRGEASSFVESILVDASLVQLKELRHTNFSKAEMAQANLLQSRFPGAVFDGVDLTLASAVNADFTEVASMDDVVFTGANMSGARIKPERTERAWFVNAEGLSVATERELHRHGGVAHPDELLQLVDARIVAGFRA